MVILIIIIWLLLQVLLARLERPEPTFQFVEQKQQPKEDDIWNHRFIKTAGLTKPVEEVEVEEVSIEEAPFCWRVLYSPSGRSASSKIIDLDDFNNKKKLLS